MNPTAETLQKMRDALANAQGADSLPAGLQKSITQATNLVWFDLQAPALSLFPVLTPLRNETPRVSGRGGTGANWKAITGINTGLVDAGVSEGNRGAVIATAEVDKLANYRGIGLEDNVTFEADYAAENFQDVKATAALNTLRATMIQEEFLILAGNTSTNLGTTGTPTLSASASGGTLPTSTASVIVVALTADGLRRSSLANGVPAGAIARTNADGSSDNINPGVAQKSANATVAVTGATGSVSASVAAIAGAAGYAWYIGNGAGNERLAAITTINSALFTSYPASSQLASALPSSDLSKNALAFDGLITQAIAAGSGAYVAQQPTGTLGTGTPLTSDGAGGIQEFTTAFQYFWDNYRLSPDAVWVSAQEAINITKKIVANGGAPLVRYTESSSGDHSEITGGAFVKAILNPITQTMVRLRVHPNQSKGTVLFTTKSLPYPMSGVGNVWQVKTRRDYYQIEWPLRTRKYEYGVYADEVLQHYFPSSLGVISNIGNG